MTGLPTPQPWTGNNHSVWLANIAAHYIIIKIAGELKTSELFKYFIGDIIWVSFGKQQTECIKHHLKKRL